MKKHILFFNGLIVVVILIALAVTFSQVGLFPTASRNDVRSFNAVSEMAGGLRPSPKMADSSAEAPSLPRKITKTGNLDLLVELAEATVQDIQAIAEGMAGYVSNSRLYEVAPGIKAGSVTIRVPADKFNDTMEQIKKLALKVENENVNANDVTDQFIDLEARLKNLEAEEEQYLDILKKAEKIEDIVNVTNRLNRVRSQIDSWQGQLKYLNSQVDLSTITVNLTAEKEVQILGLNWRPFTVIKQAVRSLLNGLVNYVNLIVAVVIFLPVVILWLATVLIIVWLIWRGYRLFKTGFKSKKKTKKSTSVAK